MKKFILALLLIGFLAVAPSIVLGTCPCAAVNVLPIGDEEKEAACLLIEGCEWVGGSCVVQGAGAGAPGAGLLEHPEGLIICPIETIRIIANLLFGILALVAVIFIILGAFALMTAQGDATKIETGRTQILYAIIAVIVAAVSWGAVTWILEQIGAT